MVRAYVNEAIDSILHDGSLPGIELLQTSFPNNERLMISISTLLDPRYVFLIYAPILFALNKKIGYRVIIALSLTEWSNQILKWLLAGERPYWYVHERAAQLSSLTKYDHAQDHNIGLNFTNMKGPLFILSNFDMNIDEDKDHLEPIAQLRQFPVTCELGAGSPSGHAMVTGTVWYVLIDAFLKSQWKPQGIRLPGGLTSSIISWTLYTIMLISVSLSRVYLACHFPHQCVCGALLGILVGWFVCEHIPVDKLSKTHFCIATVIMFTSALGTYAVLGSMGFDPLWSVHKGTRWCVKPEYIHLDTSPFSSMMRYIGFCLGVGLSFSNKAVKATSKGRLFEIFITAMASILFGQFMLALPIPRGNLNLFYGISFVNYTIFSYALAGPIPKLVNNCMEYASSINKLKGD